MSLRRTLAAVLILLASGCEQPPDRARTTPYAADTAIDVRSSAGQFVNVFLVETQPVDRFATEEEIGCGDRLVPVPVRARSDDVEGVLIALFGQPDTLGLQNVLHPNEGLSVDSLVSDGGLTSVFLSGGISIGGVCDHPRLSTQLQATARASATTDSVAFYLNGEPLDEWLSLR